MDKSQINQLNMNLRAQPWYQAWFQARGLNPNHVQLDHAQRADLAKEAARNGMPLPPHLIIDPAGNTNTEHGFAGQPTWLKALEIGGAGAAGAFFGGPALMGLFGHAAPTAALGAGEASTGLGATGGLIPGLSSLAGGFVPEAAASGMATGLPSIAGATGVPSITGVGGASAAAKAPSILDRFLHGGSGQKGDTGGNLADASKLLGSYAQAGANNRFAQAELGQNHDQTMLAAQGNQRTNESDALHKLAITSYLANGGYHAPASNSIQLNGEQRALPNLGYGPTPASSAQQEGAKTLQAQLLKRLQPGGSYMPTDPSTYSHPGIGERIANTGSLITGGLGVAKSIFGL